MNSLRSRLTATTLMSVAALSMVGLTAAPAQAATTSLTALGTANVRLGPTSGTAIARTVASGTQVGVTCKVTGQKMTNANGYASSTWYRTTAGDFIWDGTVDTAGKSVANCTGGQAAVARAITKYNNTRFDSDGAWAGECYDMANQFALDNGMPQLWTGNKRAYGAYTNYATNGNSTNYLRVANGPNNLPKAGDLIVWDSSTGGGAGHIAVVVAADMKTFTVLEMNAPTGSAARVHEYSWSTEYSSVLGWLSPRQWN